MSTVKITYFDSEAVRRALDRYVGTLAGQRPEVEQIILFGSLASGTPVPGSDVDLLIILSSSDRPFLERVPAFLPSGFPVGMDVFPYTREELERMKQEGNALVLGALREGVTIFRR